MIKTGGWFYEIKTGSLFWDEQLFRIYGFNRYSFAENSGEKFIRSLRLYEPDDRQIILSKFKECEDKGISFSHQCYFIKQSGEIVFADHSFSPVFENGEITRLIGSVSDISEYKIKSEENEKTRESFQNALTKFSEPICVTDFEGIIESMNPSLKGILGLEKLNFEKVKLHDLIVQENIKKLKTIYEKVREKGFFAGSIKFRSNSKNEKKAEIRCIKHFCNGKKSVLFFLNFNNKESEKVRTDRSYRELYKNNIANILLIEPETRKILDANPSACNFYGYSREELTSMKISDINTLELSSVSSEISKALTEEKNSFDFRHRLSDGTIKDVEVMSGPVDLGDRTFLCSIIKDVTERKTLEKEKEKLISDLKKALEENKILKGIIPICSVCKKIRDDKGFWNMIELYIEKHSDASFSHGICPSCTEEKYGKEDFYKNAFGNKNGSKEE